MKVVIQRKIASPVMAEVIPPSLQTKTKLYIPIRFNTECVRRWLTVWKRHNRSGVLHYFNPPNQVSNSVILNVGLDGTAPVDGYA